MTIEEAIKFYSRGYSIFYDRSPRLGKTSDERWGVRIHDKYLQVIRDSFSNRTDKKSV
jgi:hypothetical protein